MTDQSEDKPTARQSMDEEPAGSDEKTKPEDPKDGSESSRDEAGPQMPPPDYEEKYKRALADYANLERRTATDIHNKINQATDGLVRDFLEVCDEFTLARDAYRKAGLKTDGLDSVIRNAEAMLKRRNILAIESEGRAFDPHIHEALSSETNPDLDEQTIIRVIRKGYKTNGRVIRPALVIISNKGDAQ